MQCINLHMTALHDHDGCETKYFDRNLLFLTSCVTVGEGSGTGIGAMIIISCKGKLYFVLKVYSCPTDYLIEILNTSLRCNFLLLIIYLRLTKNIFLNLIITNEKLIYSHTCVT